MEAKVTRLHKQKTEPKGPWMQTYSGMAVSMVAPTRDMILLGDIAHHLAMECRYAGASKFHYSVAQHSYLMFQEAKRAKMDDPEFLLELLLHDAHEAYTKDIHAPLKWAMDDFDPIDGAAALSHIERVFDGLVRSMWQLPMKKSFMCIEFDMRMLFTERAQLLSSAPFDWRHEGRFRPFDLQIVQWTPTMAEKTWFLAVKETTEARFKKGAQ